ncbi:MAG: sugar transferase [Eubacteriales bacterium]
MSDFMFSLMGIFVLSPLFLFLIIAIKLDSKGPIFFRQRRIGKNKKIFEILKFRTMYIDAPHDIPTHMLSDPGRYITKMGKILRRTSLDELPQLINILKSDMYICAPRPALWNQYDLIAERDKYVGRYNLTANQICPGLTGWAQINGRDTIEIIDKAKLDGEYMQKLGFFMDCKCFLGTITKVLKRDGVVEGGINKIKRTEQTQDNIINLTMILKHDGTVEESTTDINKAAEQTQDNIINETLLHV